MSAFERAAASVRGEEAPIVSLDDFAPAEPEPVSFGGTLADDDASDGEDEAGEESLDASEAAEEEQAAPPAPQAAADPSEEERMLQAEELPQVITADLLRQRMAARRQGGARTGGFGSPDDLEVPAELLESLETAEEEDGGAGDSGDSGPERKRGKGRRAAQMAPKKPPRRPRTRLQRERDAGFRDYGESEFDT